MQSTVHGMLAVRVHRIDPIGFGSSYESSRSETVVTEHFWTASNAYFPGSRSRDDLRSRLSLVRHFNTQTRIKLFRLTDSRTS